MLVRRLELAGFKLPREAVRLPSTRDDTICIFVAVAFLTRASAFYLGHIRPRQLRLLFLF